MTDALLASARHVHVSSLFLQPALRAGWPRSSPGRGELGLTTSLDTNWDPTGQLGVARGDPRGTDVFLPNAAELLAVTGGDPADADDPAGRPPSTAPRRGWWPLGPPW